MPDVKYSVWLEMAPHISQMAVHIASSTLPRSREAHCLWLSHSPRDHGKPEGQLLPLSPSQLFAFSPRLTALAHGRKARGESFPVNATRYQCSSQLPSRSRGRFSKERAPIEKITAMLFISVMQSCELAGYADI